MVHIFPLLLFSISWWCLSKSKYERNEMMIKYWRRRKQWNELFIIFYSDMNDVQCLFTSLTSSRHIIDLFMMLTLHCDGDAILIPPRVQNRHFLITCGKFAIFLAHIFHLKKHCRGNYSSQTAIKFSYSYNSFFYFFGVVDIFSVYKNVLLFFASRGLMNFICMAMQGDKHFSIKKAYWVA